MLGPLSPTLTKLFIADMKKRLAVCSWNSNPLHMEMKSSASEIVVLKIIIIYFVMSFSNMKISYLFWKLHLNIFRLLILTSLSQIILLRSRFSTNHFLQICYLCILIVALTLGRRAFLYSS